MLLSQPNHIAFCRYEGEPVFLDEVRNRYFLLKPTERELFVHAAGGGTLKPDEMERLIVRGVAQAGFQGGEALRETSGQLAAASILEGCGSAAASASTRSVATSLARMLWRKRTKPFQALLDGMRNLKSARYAVDPDHACSLAKGFYRARARVPVTPVCLPDSMALMSFLARHRVSANLVIGVRLNPFGAHCWVQTEDILLNETTDIAARYQPIRII